MNNFSQEELINFFNIVDDIPLIVMIANKEGDLEYVNQKFEAITGYSCTEVTGKNPRFLKSGQTSEKGYQRLWEMISSGQEWKGEFDNLTKKGQLYWVSAAISPIKNKYGEITHFIAIEEDITEKKRDKERIRKERDLAQKYLDVARAMIVVLDKNGKIEMINQKGAEILKDKSERLIAKDWFSNFIPDEKAKQVKEQFYQLLSNEEKVDFHYENIIVNSFGEKRFIEWYSTVIVDQNGKKLLSSGQDITERKEMEKMREDLINTVSHEIRTPLSSLLGFTELLLEQELDTTRSKKYLKVIHQESNRLKNLINDFLDVKKMESGFKLNKRVFSLEKLIKDVVELYSITQSHNFTIRIENNNLKVMADYDKIKQVLSNLISNAIKYSAQGSTIKIVTTNNLAKVKVSIIDQGVGIAQIDQRRLFEKFYRVDNEATKQVSGTGLGLAICKKIVEEHQENIGVESKLGVGSTFYFTLTIVKEDNDEK